jgi:hypothetical protein
VHRRGAVPHRITGWTDGGRVHRGVGDLHPPGCPRDAFGDHPRSQTVSSPSPSRGKRVADPAQQEPVSVADVLGDHGGYSRVDGDTQHLPGVLDDPDSDRHSGGWILRRPRVRRQTQQPAQLEINPGPLRRLSPAAAAKPPAGRRSRTRLAAGGGYLTAMSSLRRRLADASALSRPIPATYLRAPYL